MQNFGDEIFMSMNEDMFPLYPTDFSPLLFTLTISLVHYFSINAHVYLINLGVNYIKWHY